MTDKGMAEYYAKMATKVTSLDSYKQEHYQM